MGHLACRTGVIFCVLQASAQRESGATGLSNPSRVTLARLRSLESAKKIARVLQAMGRPEKRLYLVSNGAFHGLVNLSISVNLSSPANYTKTQTIRLIS